MVFEGVHRVPWADSFMDGMNENERFGSRFVGWGVCVCGRVLLVIALQNITIHNKT